jgi:hypothetical protein
MIAAVGLLAINLKPHNDLEGGSLVRLKFIDLRADKIDAGHNCPQVLGWANFARASLA